MLFFHKSRPARRSRRRGAINMLMALLAVVGALAAAVAFMLSNANKVFQQKMSRSRTAIENINAAETMLVAYRQAQIKYITAVSAGGCLQANPFLVALKQGSGCAGL